MAEDKKTQLGPPGRTVRPTGSQTPVAAAITPVPATAPAPIGTTPGAGGTPAPGGDHVPSKTSYLPPVDDPLINATVAGRYVIHKKLGEGGMGAVYLATHTMLEKQVALKVLHGEFARKPDLVERFIQEAKAASRIRHENVIDISDFGQTTEGQVFFAMELLKGHDLHDEVSRARVAGQLLPWSRTKRIFLQICGALAAAHAKGIVHRDLKPENIFLVEFLGDPDFVKLLDFGIAKMTEVSDTEGARKLTKTGMLFGTPEYMSPEQARGETVDHRVDVYAMGCILFQLVTGQVPFMAENFMGVLSMHLTEPPPSIPPEVFDQIGAPRALAQVIDRALSKDRNARWQSIDELANAVRKVSGDPIPGERGTQQRAASVPAPAATTRARASSPAAGAAPVAVADPRETGRVKTQWTGNLVVPDAPADAPRGKSKLPFVIGGVVVLGGIVAVAVVLGGGDGKGNPSNAGSGSATGSALGAAGSAMIGSSGWAGSGGSAATVETPPPPPEPALPDMAKIVLDSTPHGAQVTDLSNGKVLGKTPLQFSVPGSKTARQFAFHLSGYGDTTVELLPSHETVRYTETLQKGASTGTSVVHKVPDATTKPLPGTGSGSAGMVQTAVTHPDTGSATTHPDTGSAAVHPETGSAAKPNTGSAAKPDPGEDCPDDGSPCIKKRINGFNTGSGS